MILAKLIQLGQPPVFRLLQSFLKGQDLTRIQCDLLQMLVPLPLRLIFSCLFCACRRVIGYRFGFGDAT